MFERWFIKSETDGLFVGHGMGLLFFSKLEDAGQNTIVIFPSWHDAARFAQEFMGPNEIAVIIRPIKTAHASYATIPELIAAGYRDDLGLLLNNFEAHPTPQ